MSLLEDLIHMTDTYRFAKVAAVDYMHGALGTGDKNLGWVAPMRFTQLQKRVVCSCMSWHPGLYRQMAQCSAGVYLEFVTDAKQVFIEARLGDIPSGTQASLDLVAAYQGPLDIYDGISIDIDTIHVPVAKPQEYCPHLQGIYLDINAYLEEQVHTTNCIPGCAPRRHIKVWLPSLAPCFIRKIIHNGSFADPVPRNIQTLVLGDSIAQGFVSIDPAFSWAAQLNEGLRCDVLNQGLGGQIFQPESLQGLDSYIQPNKIIVCYGANYRYEPCKASVVSRDIKRYFAQLARMWPEARVWAITPFWHDERLWPGHPKSCFNDVEYMIRSEVDRYPTMKVVDGKKLLAHKNELMADGFEHPSLAGHQEIAQSLIPIVLSGIRNSTYVKTDALAKVNTTSQALVPVDLPGQVALAKTSKPKGAPEDKQGISAKPYGVQKDLDLSVKKVQKTKGRKASKKKAGAHDNEPFQPQLDLFAALDKPCGNALLESMNEKPSAKGVGGLADKVPDEVSAGPPGKTPGKAADKVPGKTLGKAQDESKTGSGQDGSKEVQSHKKKTTRTRTRKKKASVELENKKRALEFLDTQGIDAIPLSQALRRGVGKVLVQGDTYCAVEIEPGFALFHGKDIQAAQEGLKKIDLTKTDLEVCGRQVADLLARDFNMEVGNPFVIGVCQKAAVEPLELQAGEQIEVLGPLFLDLVCQHYDFVDFLGEPEIESRLERGVIVGVFTSEGQLAGFIGQHNEGSIGMLEVFPDFRHRGYARALEVYKTAEHIEKGYIPWCQVFTDNQASLSLQEKLGYEMSEKEHFFVSHKDL